MKASIALLSNINIAPLQQALQKEGFGEVYVAGYNQWQSELLNLSSGLYTAAPNYVVVYLHPGEWEKGMLPASQITQSIAFYLQHAGSTVLLCEMVDYPLSAFTYLTSQATGNQELNQQLHAFCVESKRTRMISFSSLVMMHGYTNLFDDKYWYLGRMKFSLEGYRLLARELWWFVHALEGKTRKLLVLDLDNTLWGGILGEDGASGIQVSGEGKGLIYKEFQELIKQLSTLGVVLAICSKNNEEEVKELFESHPQMHLRWNDFAAHRVNWLPKHENLQSIAQELNLGLDSVVFIDDSAAERELVRQSLPEVVVPEFPGDISRLHRWMLEEVIYPYFARTSLTAEDTQKTAQYQRNAARERERDNTISYDQFISSLHIEISVDEATESSLARIAQLTQKTNQFNMTTKRYTEAEINELYRQPDWKFYTCRYRDKFGDEGIVGTFLVHLRHQQATIDNFLVSCRALGRKAEYRMLDELTTKLGKLGITTIRSHYCKSERNLPAAGVYKNYGFKETEANEYEYKI